MFVTSLLSSLSLLALAESAALAPQACSLTFDGRIKSGATPADFDNGGTGFRSGYVLGQNLKWADVIQLPNTTESIGDKASNSKALEVTISDKSLFNPSGNKPQAGFRRAELLAGTSGTSSSFFTGQQSLHFSVQLDTARPLNYSHEYQLFFIESSDYNTNQVVLKTGTILDGTSSQKSQPKYLRLLGNLKTSPPKVLYETSFTAGWHNFGLTMDFSKNTVQVYYSQGGDALKAVGSSQSNDLSGQGEMHFGLLKKPTESKDVVNSGYQESRINEGVIYGGIYEEAGALGCSTS